MKFRWLFVCWIIVFSGCSAGSTSEMEDRKMFCIKVIESSIFEKVNPLGTAVNVTAESASNLPGIKNIDHPPPYGKGKPIYNWENFEKYVNILFNTNEKDSVLALEYTALRVIRQWHAEELSGSVTLDIRKEVASWRATLIQRLNIAEHPEVSVRKLPQVIEAQEEKRKKNKSEKESKKNEIKSELDQKPVGRDYYVDRTYTILHWGEK